MTEWSDYRAYRCPDCRTECINHVDAHTRKPASVATVYQFLISLPLGLPPPAREREPRHVSGRARPVRRARPSVPRPRPRRPARSGGLPSTAEPERTPPPEAGGTRERCGAVVRRRWQNSRLHLVIDEPAGTERHRAVGNRVGVDRGHPGGFLSVTRRWTCTPISGETRLRPKWS